MKAMILAAGRGERMHPLTKHTPKPLLKIAGKPLIQYHLENLAASGITEIVINVAYLGDQIEALIGDGSQWGVNIEYSRETVALDTGGGVQKALSLLGVEPFITINADVWTDFSYAHLMHLQPSKAHLVLVDNPAHNVAGDFTLTGGHENNDSTVHNKNTMNGKVLTFAGVSVLNAALFDGIVPGIFPLAPILRQMAELGQVSGQHFKGQWFDIGTPERLNSIDKLLQGAN